MTKTAQQIHEIAEQLAPGQQEVLLDIARNLARSPRFYDTMSAEQHAALDEGIAEADRGEGVGWEELQVRFNALFSHHGA